MPSPTSLEIELPPMPDYDIRRPETIGLAIPPRLVLTQGAPRPLSDWIVLPSVGVPSVLDAARRPLHYLDEIDLQTNGTLILLEIASDAFVDAIGLDSEQSIELLDGITSMQHEPRGWNAAINPSLTFDALHRSADGGTVVQKASFVKALEISVELKLADGPLLLCPCCFKDALEADLDVEVLAPTGVKLAISATEAAASNLETVAGLLEPAAPRNGKAAAAGGKKGAYAARSGSSLVPWSDAPSESIGSRHKKGVWVSDPGETDQKKAKKGAWGAIRERRVHR